MHEFLTTNECRTTGMSVYLNGEDHAVTCKSLESELCDNCKVHLSHTVKMGAVPSMQDIARVYLTSETSTDVSIGEAGGDEGTGVGSLSMVSGWTNFCGARCLGSGFDILEKFVRALALGLRGRGILLLLRVLVTIIDAQMAEKVFCRELSKINVSETDFTKVAQSYELDCK